jgi:hypothetical protein
MFELPFVEHDHTTKQVRGLAHHRCNVAFGLLQEDPEIIQTIAQKAADLKKKRLRLVAL